MRHLQWFVSWILFAETMTGCYEKSYHKPTISNILRKVTKKWECGNPWKCLWQILAKCSIICTKFYLVSSWIKMFVSRRKFILLELESFYIYLFSIICKFAIPLQTPSVGSTHTIVILMCKNVKDLLVSGKYVKTKNLVVLKILKYWQVHFT